PAASAAAAARSTSSTRKASAACHPRSGGTPSKAARTQRWRSAGRTRSRTPSARKASRTPASGPRKPPTTCAPTSTPPPSPASTSAASPNGYRASAKTNPRKSSRPPPVPQPTWVTSSPRCAAKRTRLWRLLDGIGEGGWHDAIEMDGAQVAVADYRSDWWPANTTLMIRRVRLDPGQVSADLRSLRRRTLHPGQHVLPITGLAGADAIYGYSFILTNLDVSSPDKAAAAEHWYRHRTTIENIFRDSKHGAALRHLPSGYPEVNTAWMWGALLAASMAAWLHQLTAATRGEEVLEGHGTRGGKA